MSKHYHFQTTEGPKVEIVADDNEAEIAEALKAIIATGRLYRWAACKGECQG